MLWLLLLLLLFWALVGGLGGGAWGARLVGGEAAEKAAGGVAEGAAGKAAGVAAPIRPALKRIQLEGTGISNRGATRLLDLEMPGRTIEATKKNEGASEALLSRLLGTAPKRRDAACEVRTCQPKSNAHLGCTAAATLLECRWQTDAPHACHVAVEVTAAGATIQPDGWGVAVTVPAGAVPEGESVHVELVVSFEWTSAPDGLVAVSPMLLFSPAS